jgi:hypothetical protein
MKVPALLDTGAIGGNLVVESVANALLALNLAVPQRITTVVCDASNHCKESKMKITFKLGFICETKQKDRQIEITATVVPDNQPYQLIIGRTDIKEWKLVK